LLLSEEPKPTVFRRFSNGPIALFNNNSNRSPASSPLFFFFQIIMKNSALNRGGAVVTSDGDATLAIRVANPGGPPLNDHRTLDSPDSSNAFRQEDGAYIVTVPDGIRSGQQFPVTLAGQTLMVMTPPNAHSGTHVRVVPPPRDISPLSRSRFSLDSNGPPLGNKEEEETQLLKVAVPPGVKPGKLFELLVKGVRCLVTCLLKAILGHIPPRSSSASNRGGVGVFSNAVRQKDGTYIVTVPNGIRSGQQFPVSLAGQAYVVMSPPNAHSGTHLRVVPPPRDISALSNGAPSGARWSNVSSRFSLDSNSPRLGDKEEEETQWFQVVVPPGVVPGKPFELLVGGLRGFVTCPLDAVAGQWICFHVPKALMQQRETTKEDVAMKLSYDVGGWTRVVRASDEKLQWVHMDGTGDVDHITRFVAETSAYVRKLKFRPGTDPRVRDAVLTLVPAAEALVDSHVLGNNGEVLVTYSEIAAAQVKSFKKKTYWFQKKCLDLGVDWKESYMRICVRREFLLEDSVDAVMSLSQKDFRKHWCFEFIGEMRIDASGLTREWFQLVTAEVFGPNMGLWQSKEADPMNMVINPASSTYPSSCHVYHISFLYRSHDVFWIENKSIQNIFIKTTWCTSDSWVASWVEPSLIDSSWPDVWHTISISTCWVGRWPSRT
jgi:hypothetical protein